MLLPCCFLLHAFSSVSSLHHISIIPRTHGGEIPRGELSTGFRTDLKLWQLTGRPRTLSPDAGESDVRTVRPPDVGGTLFPNGTRCDTDAPRSAMRTAACAPLRHRESSLRIKPNHGPLFGMQSKGNIRS